MVQFIIFNHFAAYSLCINIPYDRAMCWKYVIKFAFFHSHQLTALVKSNDQEPEWFLIM